MVVTSPPGTTNQKGQLVCYHPGTARPWQCYRCQEELSTNKLFEKHCLNKHGISEFVYCCKCGYSSENSTSIGSHMRYCDGNPPIEHQLSHKCTLCKFSSDSKTGVTVHMSREHPAQYNETDKNFKWTEAEHEYLAETLIDLKNNRIRNATKVAAEKLRRTE